MSALGLAGTRTLADPADVLDLVEDGTDLIVSMSNGEPTALLDAIEDAAREGDLRDLRIHQMHPLRERDSMAGGYRDRLRHVSYFLSGATRGHVGGGVEYVPANFSEVPQIIKRRARKPLVLASVAERGGALHWGTNGEYVAALVRDGVPAVLEVNAAMPAPSGPPLPDRAVRARLDLDRPLVSTEPATATEEDRRIAALVAERIPHGATLQIGIGAIPDMVLEELGDHLRLRVHTELLTDGIVALAERGAAASDPMVATFALGSQRLYDFMDGNPDVRIKPVDEVNAPRVIAAQPRMVSICATTEVDLYGQCASATVAGRWYSGSGGQLDFMRGVHIAPDGQGFIVLRSTVKGMSRIKPALTPGSAVTTGVHFVDKVVTEYGVAELRDRSLSERARALIAVAHPDHRSELTAAARDQGLI